DPARQFGNRLHENPLLAAHVEQGHFRLHPEDVAALHAGLTLKTPLEYRVAQVGPTIGIDADDSFEIHRRRARRTSHGGCLKQGHYAFLAIRTWAPSVLQACCTRDAKVSFFPEKMPSKPRQTTRRRRGTGNCLCPWPEP